MKERIILAPGLYGSELTRNLVLHGVNTFNLRIFGTGEFARYVLMRSGVTINEAFIDSEETSAIVAEAIKDEKYFENSSYADIQAITAALRQMRSLTTDPDEGMAIAETMDKGIFKAKNHALVSVYSKYVAHLKDHNQIDSISLILKAIDNCQIIDAEFVILEEYPITPLERKLIENVSDGNYSVQTIGELFNATDNSIRLESIKNCYGVSNEVESIITDIYSGNQLDQCAVAVTDISTYGQLFFDYALLYNIPMTFGCGLPIINSNPARFLMLYNQWTSGFFGAQALLRMIRSDCFNRAKLVDVLSEVDEDIDWKSFYKYLGDIKLTNDSVLNKDKLEDYKESIKEESEYIIPGESKEYNEFVRKQKCIVLLDKMSEELALPIERFISKYAYIRQGNDKFSKQITSELDRAAISAIYEELKTVRESGMYLTDDIVQSILKRNVLNQSSKAGCIHITSIEKALCSIRENLYIAGLSSSKYPGSPRENHLLLDADIKLFGPDAEYLMSSSRIRRKRESLTKLVKLASDLGSKIYLSYSGLDVSELKHDNASSMIYKLYEEANGGTVFVTELEEKIIKVGYFEPKLSATRLIGDAYIDEDFIRTIDPEYTVPEAHWNIDNEYSPTVIETFMGCPRAFMLNRVLGIPEPNDEEELEVISAIDTGLLAHSLMEQLANNDMTLEDFMKMSREFFNRFIDEHPPIIPDKISHERDVFLEMMENAYETDPHRKVVLKEEDIHTMHPSGVKLHGFPDRVEELEDGSVLIVDYKTGRNVKHTENDFYSCLQVIIYAYLMESLGYKVSGCEYRYIRRGQTVTCKYDDEMRSRLNDCLELFKQMMLAGDFPCGYACDYCKYEGICGKEAEERVFDPNETEELE